MDNNTTGYSGLNTSAGANLFNAGNPTSTSSSAGPQTSHNLQSFGYNPPPSTARIHAAILCTYNTIRRKSVWLYEVELDITPVPIDTYRYVVETSALEPITLYRFRQGYEAPKVLPVRVNLSPYGRAAVWVKDGEWQSLEDWMSRRIKAELTFDPVQHQNCMNRYWHYTGQTFRLFELPPEVRNTIYDLALFPERDENGAKFTTPFRKRLSSRDFYPPGGHNHRLLHVNRQVYHEASKVLYSQVRFVFYSYSAVERFFNLMPMRHLNQIQYIELHLSDNDFLMLFGNIYTRGPKKNQPWNRHEWYIGSIDTFKMNVLEHLEELIIHITHPAQLYPLLPIQNIKDIKPFCHKKIVDLILKHAKPFIYRQHRHVKLAGFVKTSQKTQYMKQLEQFAEMRNEFIHNRGLDKECKDDEDNIQMSIKPYEGSSESPLADYDYHRLTNLVGDDIWMTLFHKRRYARRRFPPGVRYVETLRERSIYFGPHDRMTWAPRATMLLEKPKKDSQARNFHRDERQHMPLQFGKANELECDCRSKCSLRDLASWEAD